MRIKASALRQVIREESAKIRELGLCGYCGRQIKVPGEILAAHGYKRPGTGQTFGHCPGSGNPPLEISPVTAEMARDDAKRQIEDYEKNLKRLPNATSLRHPWRKDASVKKGDQDWDYTVNHYEQQFQRGLRFAQETLREKSTLVEEWRPSETKKVRELPPEVARGERQEKVRRGRMDRYNELKSKVLDRLDKAFAALKVREAKYRQNPSNDNSAKALASSATTIYKVVEGLQKLWMVHPDGYYHPGNVRGGDQSLGGHITQAGIMADFDRDEIWRHMGLLEDGQYHTASSDAWKELERQASTANMFEWKRKDWTPGWPGFKSVNPEPEVKEDEQSDPDAEVARLDRLISRLEDSGRPIPDSLSRQWDKALEAQKQASGGTTEPSKSADTPPPAKSAQRKVYPGGKGKPPVTKIKGKLYRGPEGSKAKPGSKYNVDLVGTGDSVKVSHPDGHWTQDWMEEGRRMGPYEKHVRKALMGRTRALTEAKKPTLHNLMLSARRLDKAIRRQFEGNMWKRDPRIAVLRERVQPFYEEIFGRPMSFRHGDVEDVLRKAIRQALMKEAGVLKKIGDVLTQPIPGTNPWVLGRHDSGAAPSGVRKVGSKKKRSASSSPSSRGSKGSPSSKRTGPAGPASSKRVAPGVYDVTNMARSMGIIDDEE